MARPWWRREPRHDQPVGPPVDVTEVVPAAGRPSHWATAGGLRPTVSPRPPLVGVPLGTAPELTTTRAVLARPVHFDHPVVPPVGLVRNLAAARAEQAADGPAAFRPEPGPSDRSAEPTAPPAPPERPVVAVSAPATPPVTLVHAVDSYVGQAREPAVPFTAPAWLRAAPPPEPEPFQTAPPSFLAAAHRVEPAPVSRRRNLGQSRRVGLGKPELRHPGEQPPSPRHDPVGDGDEEPDRDQLWIAPSPPPDPPTPAADRRRTGEGLAHPRPPQPIDQDALIREVAAAIPVPPPPDPVPDDVVAHFREVHGADVSGTPVHRGPDVGAQAGNLGARAFTAGEQVYLPREAGPLTSVPAKALLAHELTHVVQQRSRAVPGADTDEGRAMENQARLTERHFGGDTPLVHPKPPVVTEIREVVAQSAPDVPSPADYVDRIADELVRRGLARRENGSLVFGTPLPEPVAAGAVQLAEDLTFVQARKEIQDLVADMEPHLDDKSALLSEDQTEVFAKFLVDNPDLLPLDVDFGHEPEVVHGFDELMGRYNLQNREHVIRPGQWNELVHHIVSTGRPGLFGHGSEDDGERSEREREERKLRGYGGLAREVGLGLAENFGGLLGMRFSRKAEREYLGLEEEREEPDTPTRTGGSGGAGPGSSRAVPSFGVGASGRGTAKAPDKAAGDRAAAPATAPSGSTPASASAVTGTSAPAAGAASTAAAGTGSWVRASPTKATPAATTPAAPQPTTARAPVPPKLTKAQEDEAFAREQREERKLRDYGSLGREVGLGFAENFGGLFGMRFDRATEREVLRLPPEVEQPLPGRDEPADVTAIKAALLDDPVLGKVVRTGPERGNADSGRPQIDPADIDLDELVKKIAPLIMVRLRKELRTGRERANARADRI
ncbi:DUF4157 domain-containing protein [Umezawaea sp. Da 62-37]|uniref:eCIS core domain-containing protein n=1 Tax=Umezawaea sp. Da 62-37 TaxID=3075927 RepID=UPI0028F73811|nr:DUF4157 domain-containing protein [Umezawaea sp. Da 62-37]WNV87982.1 DUF4157 domain-containing protein [Umezawaea sp. Da 62-37]